LRFFKYQNKVSTICDGETWSYNSNVKKMKTLPTIGYSGRVDFPKKSGKGRVDQTLETWQKLGDKLLHHIKTKSHKAPAGKAQLQAAVKTGVEILEHSECESKKQQAVTELNQLKYALGDYWGQWLATIRHSKLEGRGRTTVTFNLEPELLRFLGHKKFNEQAMCTLQSAVLSLELHSISELYDLQEFLSKYSAKREQLKVEKRSNDAGPSSIAITTSQLARLFKNAKLDDYEALKSYFSHKQKIINKANKLDKVRTMIEQHDPDPTLAELLIDELRKLVVN